MGSRKSAPRYPRTPNEARSRAKRKLAAIEVHAQRLCEDIAGYWDEGAITHEVDSLMETLRDGVLAVRSAMDEEILRLEEERS